MIFSSSPSHSQSQTNSVPANFIWVGFVVLVIL